jgi:hypothetical protein
VATENPCGAGHLVTPSDQRLCAADLAATIRSPSGPAARRPADNHDRLIEEGAEQRVPIGILLLPRYRFHRADGFACYAADCTRVSALASAFAVFIPCLQRRACPRMAGWRHVPSSRRVAPRSFVLLIGATPVVRCSGAGAAGVLRRGAAVPAAAYSIGLLINSVAYAAIVFVFVIVRLVARFTSQLMWRWFLLDTLREVAPPRSRSPDIGDILDGVKAGMR